MGYPSFVLFALLIAVAPGPDSLLTLRSSVVGGRERGLWTMLGITAAGLTQGILAATGLGAVIAHAEPVFQTIRWAGVAYLAWLAFGALRAALTGGGAGWDLSAGAPRVTRLRSVRSGFLCNITNPKVLAFNLAVLPQFVSSSASLPTLLMSAVTLTVVGASVLLVIVWAGGLAANAMQRRRFRRSVDGATGAIMLGFAGLLATEH